MKIILFLLFGCAIASPLSAENSTTKPATPVPPAKAMPPMAVTEAVISAPLVCKDGAISQPAQTEVTEGGKANFTFKVAEAGEYLIHAVVNAPDEDSNSFFLNIDGQPGDPLMLWDMEVTKGFEERIVSWRGSGDSPSDEFSPKIFKLTAGEHKLIVVGREPAQLKSLAIRRASK